jgi:predicted RNase H-like nuclease (RuvC/YqgF family)
MVMSDNNKYVNLYIENALGFVHQYLNEILQLKTQNRILNDLVSEKDQVISSLQNKNDEMSHAQASARSMEEQYNSMKNKAAHVDALLSQVNEMKRSIQEKDNKIAELEALNNKINKRRSKSKDVATSDTVTTTLPLNMSVASTKTGSNDF